MSAKSDFKKMQKEVMSFPGESIYGKLITRKISAIFTPILGKTKVTPNMVTIMSIFLGILGAFFLMLPGMKCYVTGIALIFGWMLLDAIDGDLARFKNQQSMQGVYFDTLGHFIINPLVFASFGAYLWVIGGDWLFLVLAFWSFIMHQYSRLSGTLYQSLVYERECDLQSRHNFGYYSSSHPFGRCDVKTSLITPFMRNIVYYVLDVFSIGLIFGLLRLLIYLDMLQISTWVYIFLFLSVFVGSSLCIIDASKKMS